jgi:hypothetical protein
MTTIAAARRPPNPRPPCPPQPRPPAVPASALSPLRVPPQLSCPRRRHSRTTLPFPWCLPTPAHHPSSQRLAPPAPPRPATTPTHATLPLPADTPQPPKRPTFVFDRKASLLARTPTRTHTARPHAEVAAPPRPRRARTPIAPMPAASLPRLGLPHRPEGGMGCRGAANDLRLCGGE